MKSILYMRRGWSVLLGAAYVLSGFIPEAPAEEGGISEFRVIDDRALIRVASTSEAYFVFVVATNVFDLTGQPAESTVIPRRGPVTDFFFNNTNTSAGTFFFALRSNANCDPIDNDGDGIDDVIEALIPFLDSTNPADAYADHDGDGWDTRTEIYLGTNPDDPDDAFGPIDRTRFAPVAGSVVFDGGFILNVVEDMTTPFQAAGAGRAGAVWATLNVDPYPDLVAIDPFTDELQVYLGQPDGTLSLAYFLPTGGVGPLAVDARNVVGDASVDVMVGHSDGTVTFFEGDGDGGLTFRPDLTVTNLGTIVSITAEDVDGDGDLDIVVSGGEQVTILLNADDPVSSNPIANGDFSDGLQQWSVLPNGGQVSVQGGRALLEEQGAFQTGIEQAFYLPANPETLTLDLLESRLAGVPGALPDVFEVLLTDLDGSPLLPAFRPDAESLFNRGSSGDRLGTGTALNASTLSVDLSSLAGDHPARVRFALIGSPGSDSFVAIDNVSVQPDAVYAESFTPVSLPGAFINSGGLVATDRDGNGLPDILVEDAGLGILILFENQGGGVFVRNELQPFDYGCPPELSWAFDDVNPISEAKYFVADGLTWQVHPYLIDGTALDPVTPVAGTAIQSLETHPDGSRTWLIHAGDPQLYVYDANLNHLGAWSPDAISNLIDIAVAGTDLWLLSEHVIFLGGDPEDPENYETEYRMSLFENEFARISGSTAPDAQWTLPGSVVAPRYLISDALELRVMDDTARIVYNFNFAGTLLGSWLLAPENTNPRGLARSGTDLFVADRDDLVVYRYAGGMNRTSGTGTATEAFALSPSNLEPVDLSDPATPIALDSVVNGEFVTGDEVLEFTLTISDPVTIIIESISIVGEPWIFDPEYTLTDPDGLDVLDWSYFLEWDREPFSLNTTGTYTIAFQNWAQETGTFSFVARSLTPTETFPLTLGVYTTNAIAAPGDIHRYTFTLTNAAGLGVVPNDGDFELAWRVLDADGDTLFYSMFWGWEVFQLPFPAGDYGLDIFHKPDFTGEYSFTLTATDLGSPAPIDLGVTYTNTFTALPEAHAYSFTTTNSTVVLAEGLSSPGFMRWVLVGPDDEADFDNSFSTSGPRFLDTPGEYMLYVYSSDATGDYVFRLQEYTFITEPLTLGVPTTGTVASAEALLYEFDLTNNAIVNFTRISSFQSGLQWEAYGPDEEPLFNLSSFDNRGPFTLDQTGTYSVVLYSRNAFSGSGTFRVDEYLYQDDIPVTPIDFNTTVNGSITSAYWEAHYTVELEEPASVGFTRLSAFSSHLLYRFLDPDGDILFMTGSSETPSFYETTGTYTLVVYSISATVPASYSFELTRPTALPTEEIFLDTVVTSVVQEVFQLRTYDVDIIAGQKIKPESRAGFDGGSFRWSMRDPSDNVLFANQGMNPFSALPDAFVAPETGTYRVTVNGFTTYTGTTAFILYDVPPDPAPVPLVFDEIYSPLAIPAQTHRYTFTITDPVTVYYKAISLSNGSITANARLLDPDDVSVFGPATSTDNGPHLLTKPGTYTFELTDSLGTGDFYFQLWEVPQHDSIPITYSDLGTAVITAPGERWSFTFEGQAGDRVYLEALLGNNRFSARLFDPNGATLQTQTMNSDMNVVELSADGTYRIDLFFTGSSSADFDGILRFRLWNVQTAEATPLRVGDAIAGHIAGPRGRAVYTFEGEAGDRLFFDRQRLGQLLENNSSFDWLLRAPSSAVVFSNNWVDVPAVELPETGLYTLEIEGRHNQDARTFQFKVWPWNPPAPVELDVGDAVAGTLSAPGLTNIYTFTASAGDAVVLDSREGFLTTRYRLVDPSGNVIAGPSGLGLNPGSLPTNGTYQVWVTDNFATSNDQANRYSFMLGIGPLPLTPPPVADLRAIAVETPGVIVSNPAMVDVTWTVTNAGAAATSAGGWVDRIVLSADRSVYGSGDEWYFDVPRAGDLAAGETYTTNHLVAMPADYDGEFSVFVIADANNREFELNEANNVSAGFLTSVYREERPLDASPAIDLDFADGTRFPQGSQIVISGKAKAIAASENVIFILDASGSAFGTEGFDVNGDGAADERDDINHDGYVGSGWDVQLVAMEQLAAALQGTGTDLRISPIIWASDYFPLDSSPEWFGQTFIRPDRDVNGNGIPDFIEATYLTRFIFFSVFLQQLYIEGFTGFNMSPGNNLERGVRAAIERIDQAQQVGRTRVFLLVDAGPDLDGLANTNTILELASRGITFEAFQILDPAPIASGTQSLADLVDSHPASSGRATVMEETEDLIRAVVETLSVAGVTVNGAGAESVDASGRFFTPYVVQPGTQTVTVAAYDSRGVSVSREFTIVGYDANDTNDVVLTDLGDAIQLVYPGLTFRPTDNVLVADAAVANRSAFAQRSLFEARILEVIPSTASLLAPDRVDPDGVPVVLLDPYGLDLAPNATGAVVQAFIANPERERIELRTEIRGRANQLPRFTTVPPPAVMVSNLWSYSVGVIDDDGDPVDLTLVEHPADMSLAGNVLSWTPVAGDAGYHGVRLRAEDDRGGRAEQVFQILVEENVLNRPPVFFSVPVTALLSGGDYLYLPDVRDPDGDTLTFQLISPSPGFSVDPVTGAVSYPAIPDGVYELELEADDGNGGVAVQRFDLSVGVAPSTASAPMILTTPPIVAVVGQTYQYFPSAYDPDGDTLTFSLPTAPAGMDINPVNGHIIWTPTIAQVGPNAVLLRADDPGGLFASQFFTVNVQTTALNRTPLITGFPLGFATEEEPYETVVVAEDPDVDPLTFALELAPSGMTIDGASGAVSWLPPLGSSGTHTARVAVADNKGATAHLTWFIDVRASNTPPVFVSTPLTTLPAGATYRYTALAIDDEDAVSYLLVEGPSGMTIDPALGVVRWETSVADIGSVPVRIGAVDDRELMAEQVFTLEVEPDTTPPEVMVSVSSLYANPGETSTVRVAASDDVGVVSLGLLVDAVDTPLDGSGFADVVPAGSGLLPLQGYAVDAAGNTGVYEVVLRVFDPSDTNPPDIVITSPTNQTGVAMYFAVEGEISDPEDNLDYYTIDIARADTLNHIEPFVLALDCDECFTELVRVHTSSVNGVLGYIDPTVYPNDDYVIRVTAFDINGQGWTEGVVVSIQGQVKPGQFTLDFTDVRIPTRGLPIEVVRRYDSLRRESLDAFGFGWSIQTQDPDIRETVRDDVLPYSTISLYPLYVGARVFLNDPDGYRVGYTFAAPFAQSSLIGTLYSPEFNPDPGVFDALSDPVEELTVTLKNGGEAFLPLVPLPYNPSQYQLTRRDGTVYLYDQFTGLKQVTDRFGNSVTFGNDSITHSDGYTLSMLRDDLSRVVSIVSTQGVLAAYGYDDAGNLATHTDAENRTTQFFYYDDPPHALRMIIGPDGQILHEGEFDEAGRMVRQSGGGAGYEREFDPTTFTGVNRDIYGRESEVTYNSDGLIVGWESHDGTVINFEYDEWQRLIAKTTDGATVTFDYDSVDKLTAYSNAMGQVWTYAHGASGIEGMTDPMGHTIAFDVSGDDRITSVLLPNGASRALMYDAQGRLTNRVDENGYSLSMTYSILDVPDRIQWDDGSFKQFAWIPGGYLDYMIDEEGYMTFFQQNSDGAITQVVNHAGAVTSIEFDGRSRTAVRYTDADGETFTREDLYDADDIQVGFRYNFPNGETVDFGIVPGIPAAITNVIGQGVLNAWQIGQDGGTTTVADASGAVSTFVFRNDLIRSYTDRLGRERIYRYDLADRLTQEVWRVDGDVVNDVRIEYSEAGYPMHVADFVAAYTYTRDTNHQLVAYSAVGVSNSLPPFSIAYTLDPAGEVIGSTDSLGVTVTSEFDVKYDLEARSWDWPGQFDARVDVARDLRGMPVQIDRYAALTATTASVVSFMDWNHDRDLVSLRHEQGSSSNAVANYTYAYTPARWLTQMVFNAETVLYAHDPIGQLLSVDRSLGDDEIFEWDAGNPVGSNVVVGLGNRLLQQDDFMMTYDLEGNMIVRSNVVSGQHFILEYDVANRLVQIEERDGSGSLINTVAYWYDAFGRRVARILNGAPTYTVFDFAQPHADLDANTNVVAVYLNSDIADQRYGRYRVGEEVHWYLADRLQNVRQMANAQGDVIAEVDYEAFGLPISNTAPGVTDRFLWAGREYEEVGDLYYFYFRQYDPVLRRFTSPDPVGFRLGEYNTYRYAYNNPVDEIDILGFGPAVEYPWPLLIQSFFVGCIVSVGESLACDGAKALGAGLASAAGFGGGSGGGSGGGGGGGGGPGSLISKDEQSKGDFKVTSYLYDCAIGGVMNAVSGGMAGGAAGRGFKGAAKEYFVYGEQLAIQYAMRTHNRKKMGDALSPAGMGENAVKCAIGAGMDALLGENKPPDYVTKPFEALMEAGLLK